MISRSSHPVQEKKFTSSEVDVTYMYFCFRISYLLASSSKFSRVSSAGIWWPLFCCVPDAVSSVPRPRQSAVRKEKKNDKRYHLVKIKNFVYRTTRTIRKRILPHDMVILVENYDVVQNRDKGWIR